MENLYIALVDTPGLFANIIRKVIKINYIHVVLSLDENLTEAYSFGRRNPFVPFFSGFEKENLSLIKDAFPTARYKIYRITCTAEQKNNVAKTLHHYYTERSRYHYCILGLPFLLLGKDFYQKRHYTCSSFTARILEENGILSFSKPFSLVTPRDFFEYKKQNVIFEGNIHELPASHGEDSYNLCY